MDRWMKVQAEDTTVRLAECPRCTGAIRKTVRYNRVINRNLGLVETVKKRLRGEVRLWRNLFNVSLSFCQESPELLNDIERLVTDESNAVGKDEKPLNSDQE